MKKILLCLLCVAFMVNPVVGYEIVHEEEWDSSDEKDRGKQSIDEEFISNTSFLDEKVDETFNIWFGAKGLDGVYADDEYFFESSDDLTAVSIIDSGTCGADGDNLTWTLDIAGKVTISGNGRMLDYSGSLTSSPFKNNSSITSVVVEEGVTTIGSGAFSWCSDMTSLSLPESLESIGESAFYYCSSLTNVTIPVNVGYIWSSAFDGCSNLTIYGKTGSFAHVYANRSNKNFISTGYAEIRGKCGQDITWCLDSETGVLTISGSGNMYDYNPYEVEGDSLFSWNTAITSLVINQGITNIGECVFYNCVNLTSVELSNTIKAIGYEAFHSCSNLKSISISRRTSNIDQGAFNNCTSMTDVYYSGSKQDWRTITIGKDNIPLTNATIHYALETYTITYDANGGTGTPSDQIKEEDVPMVLSSIKPSLRYIIQYNANGGSVSPASKNIYCTFDTWNTKQNGTGTSYSPGQEYTNNADVTLYAQWRNSVAGTLATPTRDGYEFVGWYTSSTEGEQINEASAIVGNTTIYAHWTDPYNLRDETYSFENYGDSDSFGGHCFGMSMTSAGYHTGLLNISRIGGNVNTPLYSFSGTQTVKNPICYYQSIQGKSSSQATVAGGCYYLNGYYNIDSDWQDVVNFVKNHEYDESGLLQIGFRKRNQGGHAINFLRYENVNGQDRIYAYDNNFPEQETYFYKDNSGYVRQTPVQTFSGTIDCIALRDVRIYFANVGDFDSTHALYMPKDAASVEGYTYTYMEGEFSDEEYVMYEIPADVEKVIITPKIDNADFIYMDTEYSFGQITDETRGELKFSSLNESGGSTAPQFRIFETTSFGDPDFILPSSLREVNESAFEEIVATTVFVPDSCTSIGSYAFRNASIRKIRIPAGCTVASNAFYGCNNITIFGTPGSSAQAYCDRHSNCTFAAE